MSQKRNAPALGKREGVVCLHSRADTDAYNSPAARVQFFSRRCPIICKHLGHPADMAVAA
jgi:hypothetical protein